MSGLVVWFTGLSGAGKSTLAEALARSLEEDGRSVIILDGDRVRAASSSALEFSRNDIVANGARIVAMAQDERETHDFVMVSVITPFEIVRQQARDRLRPGYVEVFVAASVEVCRQRDTKGLYAREARGNMDNLIGVSPGTPFQPPLEADLVLDTGRRTVEECLAELRVALGLEPVSDGAPA